MKEDPKIKQSMQNLANALQRLQEALVEPENVLIVDATIQRFEFVLEANTPREVLKKAYAAKWINNEKVWLADVR